MKPRIPSQIAFTLAALAMAACAMPPEAPPPTAEGCDAGAAQRHVGRVADAPTIDAARRDAGAATARTLSPGQVVTMEYRGDRLNLHVDGARRITRVACG